MAIHRAKQITDYIHTELLGNLPSFAANVFANRVLVYEDEELPACNVKKSDDVPIGDRGRLNNGRIDRYLEIDLELSFKVSTKISEKMHEGLVEVYEAMMSSSVKVDNDFIIDYWHVSDGEPVISQDGERPIGTIRSAWIFHYTHSVTSPSQ